MSAPRNHVRILENQINWLVSERNEMEAVRHAQNERISVMARQLGQFVVRNGDLEFELANLRRSMGAMGMPTHPPRGFSGNNGGFNEQLPIPLPPPPHQNGGVPAAAIPQQQLQQQFLVVIDDDEDPRPPRPASRRERNMVAMAAAAVQNHLHGGPGLVELQPAPGNRVFAELQPVRRVDPCYMHCIACLGQPIWKLHECRHVILCSKCFNSPHNSAVAVFHLDCPAIAGFFRGGNNLDGRFSINDAIICPFCKVPSRELVKVPPEIIMEPAADQPGPSGIQGEAQGSSNADQPGPSGNPGEPQLNGPVAPEPASKEPAPKRRR